VVVAASCLFALGSGAGIFAYCVVGLAVLTASTHLFAVRE
jgi:hypothetical protein